ncbi:MAG: hypothetical protein MUC72_11055 [Acidobacteria bacterium]|nr:hypothetical protein [Acidobacteriota bacterium]
MKKTVAGAAVFAILVLFNGLFFAQQEIEREYVQVLNIEMLVRVMKDGRPLAGLKKGDFTLLENGRKQDINGFVEVHRSIAPAAAKEKPLAEQKQPPGRLFLLFFWISESSLRADEALDYFFKDIYRENDRVILADQRRFLEIKNAAEKEKTVAEFKAGVAELSRDLGWEKKRFRMQIEANLQDYIDCLKMQRKDGASPRCDPNMVIVRYEQQLREYRLQQQKPNVERLEAMIRALEAVDADKWALVFFQHDALPLFDTERMKSGNISFGGVIDTLEKLNRDILLPLEHLPIADALRTRFIQANTQFHLLLLDSRQAPVSSEADTRFNFINPLPVFSNWEETFRQITAATGGEIMDGNRMKEALVEVANREDVYYVLTYAPADGESRERRIDLRVKGEGVKVIHGRRVEMENLPQVKLATIEPAPGKVRLELRDLYMIGQGEQRSGLVRVTLSAAGAGEKPQIMVQDMEVATTGGIEIPIKDLEPGRYQLAVRVVDSLTGLEAQDESVLDIPGQEMPAEMTALLKLAADYSERLRHAAFRFICRETVNEDVLVRDVMDRSSHKRVRTSWLYDYQVVVRDGKVTEDRVLLRKNKTKKRVENAALETRFRSLYSAFLPATLFAADKQPAFFYRLEKHEKMYGRPVARLAVTPRPGHEETGAGTAWVDEETGAVLKIDLAQRAIKGIEAMEQRAKQSGARLLVSDVHYYGIERDGVWLPSSTTISEYYVISVSEVRDASRLAERGTWSPPARMLSSSGKRQIELSRTWVEYADFKFFVVDVQSREEALK